MNEYTFLFKAHVLRVIMNGKYYIISHNGFNLARNFIHTRTHTLTHTHTRRESFGAISVCVSVTAVCLATIVWNVFFSPSH